MTVKEPHRSISETYSYQGNYYGDSAVSVKFENADDPNQTTFLRRASSRLVSFAYGLSTLRLELITFLYSLFHSLTAVSSTTLILDKVCLVHFGYPTYVCSNLQNYTELKSGIEVLANNYQLAYTLIRLVPAAVLGCFIGPWSDLYGRKFPTIVALAGMTIDNIGSIVCAYYMYSRVEYFFIPAIFTGISGGTVTLLAVTYSYASDITGYSKRTMKYAYVEIASGLAAPLGSLVGGWTYEFFGYPPVFFAGAAGLFVALLLVVFILDETRGLDNTDSWTVKLRRLFSCTSFKESFIATAKDIPHKGRLQIILLVSSLCLVVITKDSTTNINYLYVHHQFDWSNAEYSTIIALYSVCAMLLLVVVLPLYRYLKIGDPTLGIIGTVSQLGKCLGISLASKPGIYHTACLFGLFMLCAPLASRSRISKVASRDDIGKVFSFVATAETLLPIMTTAMTSQLFNVAIDTFPGLPYAVLAVLLLFPLGVFIWLACLPRVDYERIQGKNSKALEKEVSASI